MAHNYRAGLGSVGSYQMSGKPFITGSEGWGVAAEEFKVSFPAVAKAVTVIASGSSIIKVHFNTSSDGNVMSNGHYITLDSDEDAMTFNVRCKEIYITNVTANSAWQLYAELTGISAEEIVPGSLTGSGLTD